MKSILTKSCLKIKTFLTQNQLKSYDYIEGSHLKNLKRILLLLLICMTPMAFAADTIPTVNLSLSAPNSPQQLVTSMNLVLVLTILVLAPSLVFMMTSFLRLLIVFSFSSPSARNTANASISSHGLFGNDFNVFHYGTGYERVV